MSEKKLESRFFKDFIFYGIITFALLIISIIYLEVRGENKFTIDVYLLYSILLTVFGALGAAIGNFIRKLLKPTSIEAEHFVDSFHKRIFWAFGPQFIGWIVGAATTLSILENFFGIKLK